MHLLQNHCLNKAKPLTSFPTHTDETLCDIYYKMLILSALDKKAVALQRTGYLGTYPSSAGHEAITVTLGECLSGKDVFVPYYRDQGVLLARGFKPRDIFQYWRGDERANQKGHPGDLPICIPIATQCTHAAGIAYAQYYQGSPDSVVVCSLGDGATSKGDFYEALNFCALHNLSIIFLISNNQWAISVPISAQTASKTLAEKAQAVNCRSFRVNGTDVNALIKTFDQSFKACRAQKGPILIEAVTYRLCDHTTADDASRYMPEQARLTAKDPVKELEKLLKSKGCITPTTIKQMKAQAKAYIQSESEVALAYPLASAASLFDTLYETLPEELSEQKKACLAKESAE